MSELTAISFVTLNGCKRKWKWTVSLIIIGSCILLTCTLSCRFTHCSQLWCYYVIGQYAKLCQFVVPWCCLHLRFTDIGTCSFVGSNKWRIIAYTYCAVRMHHGLKNLMFQWNRTVDMWHSLMVSLWPWECLWLACLLCIHCSELLGLFAESNEEDPSQTPSSWENERVLFPVRLVCHLLHCL